MSIAAVLVSVVINKDMKSQFPYSGLVSTPGVNLQGISRENCSYLAGRDVDGSSVTVMLVGGLLGR